ncbi:MAG: cation diffusion facilitator family transporter [Bifidobacteriaceae bacterium]|jgi:cobalt-zinc-cadmium efflux system protein|nr:cation diffusion facilitator family transporter [Bifidobacteriaceae bacterium]
MGHSHDHLPAAGGDSGGSKRAAGNRRRLAWALGMAGTVLVVEVAGAVWTGSLALLADAGHMAADSIGLVFALVASALAGTEPTPKRTYGLKRVEVLAALSNALIVVAIAVGVGVGAVGRLFRPAEVEAGPVLILAAIGLVANVVSLLILRAGAKESINVRGAYLEVMGDSLGSVAVIASAAVIAWTGWMRADAVASLVIALAILPRAYALARDVLRVLMEATPEDVDLEELRQHLEELPGVLSVHDLHAWTITSGLKSLTAHVVVKPERFNPKAYHELLDEMSDCLAGHFDLTHSTFQIEPAEHSEPAGMHR